MVIPMLWTCTTAQQNDGRRLSSVRRAKIFQRHLLERWPFSQGVSAVSFVKDFFFFLLCEGVLIAVVRCVMRTWVFVPRDAVRERLLSYARHCRYEWLFQCCGLVRQRNRTMVDGTAQSGALGSFSDICWNGGLVCRGSIQ